MDRLSTGLRKVEDSTNVVLLEYLAKSALISGRELNHLHADLVLGRGLDEGLDLLVSGKQLVAKRAQVVNNSGQPLLLQLSTEEETLTGLGHAEVHGRLDRGPVGLDEVLAEAGHLTSGGHLNAEEGVGTGQASPRELRNLGGKVITLDGHQIGGVRDVLANEGLGGHVDEVDTQDLADEGEGARSAEIALNDLQQGQATLGVLSLDNLHVERTSDLPGLGDLLSDLLDTVHSGLVQVDGRQNQCSISRVHTGLLNVLADGVNNQLALGANSIDIDLLGTLNELADDNGVVRGDVAGSLQLVLQVLLAVDNSHGGSGKDVAGADKNGVADGVSELLSSLDRSEFLPRGLIDSDAVKDLGELLSILGLVNIAGISSKDLGTASLLQAESNVLRQLTADRNDNTAGILQLINIHDTLVAELLKVESISSIEVGGISLGVVLEVC